MHVGVYTVLNDPLKKKTTKNTAISSLYTAESYSSERQSTLVHGD